MTHNTEQPEALRLADWLDDQYDPDHYKAAAATELRRQHARIAELEAARIAYASEFEPDADGDPDVGNIHANIRALKAQLSAIDAMERYGQAAKISIKRLEEKYQQ